MPSFDRLITDVARQTLKETIEDAKGNEVFFLCSTDERGLIDEATPLARGNDSAVPALLQVASQGDVIVHNHPSGYLVPSSADVTIASEYGNRGVGFYIIDNAVREVYVVVAAFKREQIRLIERESTLQLLLPEGRVARQLSGFESRREQQQMLESVIDAFNESKLALIEAGTGTGKSLAYLLPAISWAVSNKQRVVISTNTINLQEQLINKDLPLLSAALQQEFKSVLVKGRGNYVCLSKVQTLEKDGPLLLATEEQAELQALIQWAHKTEDGSRSDLSFLPTQLAWEKVACESDNCARIKCSFYADCFFYRARRNAASADLLVVNHHLLFSDLALRAETERYQDMAILPGYSHIVLDEAHNIEDVATSHFGLQVSKHGLLRQLARFYSLREKEKVRERGLLPFLLHQLGSLQQRIDLNLYTRLDQHIRERLIPQREHFVFQVSNTFDDLAVFFRILSPEATNEARIRLTPEIHDHPEWQNSVLTAVRQFLQEAREFHQQLLALEQSLEYLPDSVLDPLLPQTVELSALTDRVEAAAATVAEIFGEPDEDKVRWVEIRTRGTNQWVTLKQAPLNVAQALGQRLFDRFKTVVMTSATLTTEARFDFIRSRLGLQRFTQDRLVEQALPSSFSYPDQVILGIPTDIPLPDHASFQKAISQLIYRSIEISQGRALVLFTSYSLLDNVFKELLDPLKSMGIRALKQGETPRHRLTEIFKTDQTSVLFATDSFWEGVDVAGEALQNVILTRLPFNVPKEPVVEARVEAIEKRGGNSFLEYSVPQAVIKLKQGFGRLIRAKTDLGSILILDRRIVDRSYGKVFLRSLPKCQEAIGKSDFVLQQIEQFFRKRKTPGQRASASQDASLPTAL
ncbi:MAG: helicase C-terminal domain-containing protein [Acidobacteriota bacterium]